MLSHNNTGFCIIQIMFSMQDAAVSVKDAVPT